MAFSAAAAIALVWLVGTTVNSWQAVRATQAQRAAEQSQAAEREQKRVAQESDARTADLLSAANLNLVQANFEQSNLTRVRTLLEQTRSHADRGSEWYYPELRSRAKISRGSPP